MIITPAGPGLENVLPLLEPPRVVAPEYANQRPCVFSRRLEYRRLHLKWIIGSHGSEVLHPGNQAF